MLKKICLHISIITLAISIRKSHVVIIKVVVIHRKLLNVSCSTLLTISGFVHSNLHHGSPYSEQVRSHTLAILRRFIIILGFVNFVGCWNFSSSTIIEIVKTTYLQKKKKKIWKKQDLRGNI